jgi:hypothetical protein
MRRDLVHSHLLLVIGAAALLLLFALTSRIWEFVEPFPRIPLFLLWLIAPSTILGFNTWMVGRYLVSGESGRMFRTGAACFLLAGAVIYGRILLVPEAGQMEINLVFLFGPYYHFLAVAAVTSVYLGKGIHLLLSSRDGREQNGT